MSALRIFDPQHRRATGEHRAAATQERIVDLLLITLAPAMVVATVLLIVGILR